LPRGCHKYFFRNKLIQVWYPSSSLQNIGFKCGLPEGNDNPTNTEGDAGQPEGTHYPYGTTVTFSSTNAAGMGIARMNKLTLCRGEIYIGWNLWILGCGVIGALVVFVL
jgi:hypothetical protein